MFTFESLTSAPESAARTTPRTSGNPSTATRCGAAGSGLQRHRQRPSGREENFEPPSAWSHLRFASSLVFQQGARVNVNLWMEAVLSLADKTKVEDKSKKTSKHHADTPNVHITVIMCICMREPKQRTLFMKEYIQRGGLMGYPSASRQKTKFDIDSPSTSKTHQSMA